MRTLYKIENDNNNEFLIFNEIVINKEKNQRYIKFKKNQEK